jgi:hypothetical protein
VKPAVIRPFCKVQKANIRSDNRTLLYSYDAAREADLDRGRGDAAAEIRDVQTGGSGGDAELVRGDPGPYRAVGDAAASCRWPDACVERRRRSVKGFGLRGSLRTNGSEALKITCGA